MDANCPVCATAEIVCGKWTLLLIRDLSEGRSRFCELERSLAGISPRTLSLRLRALEEEGIVERHTYPEVPPRVEYALTEKGRALLPIIDDMRTTGDAGSAPSAPTEPAAVRRRVAFSAWPSTTATATGWSTPTPCCKARGCARPRAAARSSSTWRVRAAW